MRWRGLKIRWPVAPKTANGRTLEDRNARMEKRAKPIKPRGKRRVEVEPGVSDVG